MVASTLENLVKAFVGEQVRIMCTVSIDGNSPFYCTLMTHRQKC